MRLNEIQPISIKKRLLNDLVNKDLSDGINVFYEQLKKETNNFSYASYELFSYDIINEFLTDLSILKIEAHNVFSEVNDVLRLLTEIENYLLGK